MSERPEPAPARRPDDLSSALWHGQATPLAERIYFYSVGAVKCKAALPALISSSVNTPTKKQF